MDLTDLLARLGTALGLGLLVGLQREFASRDAPDDLFAGARTFALLGLSGGLAAYASEEMGSASVFAAALLLAGAFIALGYYAGLTHAGIGLTTEIASFVVFVNGGLAVVGDLNAAAAVGVATMAVLAIKPQIRRFAARVSREDVYATVKFAVLAVIVLPLLPTETYGSSPWDATSPFNVGLMVVFISGLSFVGYALIQVVGPNRGVALTGVLGGLVSSTAVTLTLSERSKNSRHISRPLALGLLLAWAIMFVRVVVEVAVVNAELLPKVILSVGAGAVVSLAAAGALYLLRRDRAADLHDAEFTNPFRLLPAVQFGLLYGAVLIASKATSDWLGDTGVYMSAVISGVADVDAITLSMAELSKDEGSISDDTAATAISVAAAVNTIVKGAIVFAIGSIGLRRHIIPGLVGAVVVTVGLGLAL